MAVRLYLSSSIVVNLYKEFEKERDETNSLHAFNQWFSERTGRHYDLDLKGDGGIARYIDFDNENDAVEFKLTWL